MTYKSSDSGVEYVRLMAENGFIRKNIIRSPLKTRSPAICSASLCHLHLRKNLKYTKYSCIFPQVNLSQICTTSDSKN